MASFEEEFKAATTPGPARQTPGAVVVAADKTGQIRYLNASGFMSLGPDASPINEDSTFWIASCTKLYTTVAVMQCVEKGLITLDEDISGILPEWSSPDILTGFDKESGEPLLKKATKKITLRLMLTHSSGMAYDFLSPDLMKWRKWHKQDIKAQEGDIIKHFSTPLIYEPGEGWAYSCAIDWAGKLVERLTNMRLSEYMAEHIWNALSVRLTTFQPLQNEAVNSRRCGMTARTPTGDLVSVPPLRKLDPLDDLGGGGIYCAPSDYIKLLAALLKNDGTLLKPESVAEMWKPQLPDTKYLDAALADETAGPMFRSGVNGSNAWNWGLGGILNTEDVEGVTSKGTMTWGGLPNLFWWIDPTAGTCGLYASQLLPPCDAASMALAVAFRKAIFSGSIGK